MLHGACWDDQQAGRESCLNGGGLGVELGHHVVQRAEVALDRVEQLAARGLVVLQTRGARAQARASPRAACELTAQAACPYKHSLPAGRRQGAHLGRHQVGPEDAVVDMACAQQ